MLSYIHKWQCAVLWASARLEGMTTASHRHISIMAHVCTYGCKPTWLIHAQICRPSALYFPCMSFSLNLCRDDLYVKTQQQPQPNYRWFLCSRHHSYAPLVFIYYYISAHADFTSAIKTTQKAANKLMMIIHLPVLTSPTVACLYNA